MELGERLGAGKEAAVYAIDEMRVAKVYPDGKGEDALRREAHNLAIAASQGLPAPRAHEVRRFGDSWGLVMDRAPQPPMADAVTADPSLAPAYLDAMVDLHLRINAAAADGLPSLKSRMRKRISAQRLLAEPLRLRLLAVLDALPEGDRICHGDFHPYNIMGPPESALVIDWLDAAAGPAAADVCRTVVLISPHVPELTESYLQAYLAASGLSRDDVLRWQPVVAAARLSENVPEETDRLLALAAMA